MANPCELCDNDADFVASVAFPQKPDNLDLLPPLMIACSTHIAVLLERSHHTPNGWEMWIVRTMHMWEHENEVGHTHEEGGDMTPTEEEVPNETEPEGEETPSED